MRAMISTAPMALALLGGCATMPITGGPAVTVVASGQTEPVGTANQDAADDPAIWRNAADPAASLIVATDKKAGLYVYGLDGAVKSFDAAGRLNNVDLVELADGSVLVASSKRDDPVNSEVVLHRLNTTTGTLEALGTVSSGPGEGYGLCLSQHDGLSVFAVIKDGRIREYALSLTQSTPAAMLVRELSVPSQAEGCVVDEREGTLYVGEEAGGIWRFADGATTGDLVVPIDNDALVADVEGLAIAPAGATGGYVVASSQGDNAYALFRLPDLTFAGRFRIGAGAFGATEETDGIDLALGSFGGDYPQGLFVAQDGQNAPAAQNFKLVSWGAVLNALGLE